MYHQFTLAPKDRDVVRAALKEKEIGHEVYYPIATHQQEPYLGPEYDLPVTEEMTRRVVSIPVRPDLTQEEINLIVDTLNEIVA